MGLGNRRTTMTQDKTAGKKIKDKIGAIRWLFKHGNPDPRDDHIEFYLEYLRQKAPLPKPGTIERCVYRVTQKIRLYERCNAISKVEELERHLTRHKAKPLSRIDTLLTELHTPIQSLLNIALDDEEKNMNNLLKAAVQLHLLGATHLGTQLYQKTKTQSDYFEHIKRREIRYPNRDYALQRTLALHKRYEWFKQAPTLDTLCTMVITAKHLGIDTGFIVPSYATRDAYYTARHQLRLWNYAGNAPK